LNIRLIQAEDVISVGVGVEHGIEPHERVIEGLPPQVGRGVHQHLDVIPGEQNGRTRRVSRGSEDVHTAHVQVGTGTPVWKCPSRGR
jgi:hypothetical protein